MYQLIDVYREWDGGLSSVLLYCWEVVIYIWNRHGVIGVLVALFAILTLGMKSDTFGHLFTLLTANLVRFLGSFVGFGGMVLQKIALFFGGTVIQSVIREHADKYKGMLDNLSDSMTEKKTPRE